MPISIADLAPAAEPAPAPPAASLSLDEKIQRIKDELSNVRRSRWDDEKDFYEQTEEKRCGISILRSQLYESLNRGVDFQVFHDAMSAANNDEKDPIPYMSMHFGHQVLLLSTIQQMELRKNVMRESAKAGRKMVQFLEEKKAALEQETAAIAVESVKKISECDMYIVDDAMAQKVVAQRLVIRKLMALRQKPARDSLNVSLSSSSSVGNSVGRMIVNVPTEEMEDVPMDDKSPRNVKSFVPPGLYLDDVKIDRLQQDDNMVLRYLQTGRSNSSRSSLTGSLSSSSFLRKSSSQSMR